METFSALLSLCDMFALVFRYFKDQGIFENGLGEIREFYSGIGGIP